MLSTYMSCKSLQCSNMSCNNVWEKRFGRPFSYIEKFKLSLKKKDVMPVNAVAADVSVSKFLDKINVWLQR